MSKAVGILLGALACAGALGVTHGTSAVPNEARDALPPELFEPFEQNLPPQAPLIQVGEIPHPSVPTPSVSSAVHTEAVTAAQPPAQIDVSAGPVQIPIAAAPEELSTPRPAHPVAGQPADSVVYVMAQGCKPGIFYAGTGVTLGHDLVVTNAHVVSGSTSVQVQTTDGRLLAGFITAIDTGDDTAAISVPGLGLTPLQLEPPQVGETGAIYGHPGGGGLFRRPTIVTGTSRIDTTDMFGRPGYAYQRMVQLAASADHGESGAPVINAQQHVIGIVVEGLAEPNQTWAVSSIDVGELLAYANGLEVPRGYCIGSL